MSPRTWVLLSDKQGDNGQVETIVAALPWAVERKYVYMLPQWVLGKPRYRPTDCRELRLTYGMPLRIWVAVTPDMAAFTAWARACELKPSRRALSRARIFSMYSVSSC